MGEFWNAIQNASEIERKRLLEEQEKKRVLEENRLLEQRNKEQSEKKREQDRNSEYEQKILIPFRSKLRPIFYDIQSNHPEIREADKTRIVETREGLELMWGERFGEDDISMEEMNIMRNYHYKDTSFFARSEEKIPREIIYKNYHSIRGSVSNSNNHDISIYGKNFPFEEFMNNPKIIIPKIAPYLSGSNIGSITKNSFERGLHYWIDKERERLSGIETPDHPSS